MAVFGRVSRSPEQGWDDRRREPRRRSYLKGKLVCRQTNQTADCTITDISEHGARISVNPDAISFSPVLIVVKQAVAHEARIAWRTATQAGLRFIDSLDLSGEVPPQAGALRDIWLELLPR